MSTESIIAQLHPIVAEKAMQVIQQAWDEGIPVIATQGLRTMDEQASLYAQGRTAPGQIVTNAKPGYSYHNYGLAFDYCMLKDGKACWDVNDQWKRVAQIGKDHGFAWGGDWTGFKDYPHLEMSFGLSVQDLVNGKRPPNQEDTHTMNKTDADQILLILQDYWKRMDGNKEVQDYTHYLANQVRKAAGMEVEN